MKKLVLALAIFTAFTFYSFTTNETIKDSVQFLCTASSLIQHDVSEDPITGNLTFTWNNNVYNDPSVTYTSKIEIRRGSCPFRPSPTVFEIDFFSESSFFSQPLGGGGTSNCFEYRIVLEGTKNGQPYCYTSTSWKAHP